MAYITCTNADFAYDGKTVATQINFEVNKGDYLCIIGENGSGKTTLMKGILGLLTPKSGSITTSDGLKTTSIGYLPQQTPAQKDFPASVYEIVLSGRLNSAGLLPFYSKKDKEIALFNMKRLGIDQLAKKSFRDLSGGQQQRVLLGRALCATKEALLLDEPTAGLDPLVTTQLYETIKNLSDNGITIIMVSHDMQAAITYASHILHLKNSQIFFGTIDDYKQTPIAKQFLAQ